MARDPKLAARLFEKAAAHGLAPAQYRIGNQYEKGIGVPRDLALAKLWYQRAAERGNARAMHNLAVLLAEGAGGKPDYAAAVEWFRKAADHGVRDSQFNLAVLTARGLGVQQDLGQSYAWFAIAAGQGDEDAAKKRDEVAGRLAAADLAAARARADGWKPLTPNPAANDVAVPAQGWSEAPQAASPARKAGPEKGRV
jgi:localization factor PodJL